MLVNLRIVPPFLPKLEAVCGSRALRWLPRCAPQKAMRLCFFTTLAVASSHAFVVVPSAHAQTLAARRVAPLPRAGHVVAISTYSQWDVLFNRGKVHRVCVLPTLTCTNAAWSMRPALPPSHIPLQSDLIKTSSFTPPPAKRSASVLRLCRPVLAPQIQRETQEVLLRAKRAEFQWYVDQLTVSVDLILVPIWYAVGIELGLV